jgi:hypothetical protein
MVCIPADRRNKDREQLTPCRFFPSDLTAIILLYIDDLYPTASGMSVFWTGERLHVKKMVIV